MSVKPASIVFVDNSLNKVYKSIDALKERYENVKAYTIVSEALEQILDHAPDIVFLDLDIAPDDAVTFTKEIIAKSKDPKPFIVIYSDKQDDFVQEMACNSGADSFINFQTKPAVLKPFIDNLLNRRIRQNVVDKRNIIIDREKYLIFNKGEPIHLPRKEFSVFELLYNHPSRFFSKLEIANEIWSDDKIAAKRTIDVHIYNIRRFFGKRVIQSKKGMGYKINTKVI